jgi:hypothetical protein
LRFSVSGGDRGERERLPVDSSAFQERRKEMEAKNENTEGKGKLATYARWFFVTVFGVLILFTVIMAVYRKFGG